MKLNKTTLAIVTAGLLGVGASGVAQASVSATALLDMTNLTFSKGGVILDYNTDFMIIGGTPALTFTSTADVEAYYNLSNSSATGGNPPTSPLDLPLVCEGPNCGIVGADNGFPVISGPATGAYSAADQNEFGAPIANVPDLTQDPPTIFPNPASIQNAAYTGIDDLHVGTTSANSNNNLNSSFIFALTSGGMIDIDFDMRAYLEAHVDASENFPGFATAAYNQEFAIDNLITGARVFDWSPDGSGTISAGSVVNSDPFDLNTTVSLNAPLPIDVTSTGGIHTVGAASVGHFSATTPFLVPGQLYQLSARTFTSVDAQRIPEPATTALLGIGMLGMAGAALRRRRDRAAK